MKKNLLLTTLAFVAMTSIYADDMDMSNQPPMPMPIRMPADIYMSGPDYCFEIEGSALYMQPTASNLHYAAEAIPLPVYTPNWNIQEIKPSYNWGFDLAIAGISHCTHSNLALSWQHFRSSDSNSFSVPTSSDMVGPFFEIGPDASAYTNASGNVTFLFDEGSIDYGIFANFGDRAALNFFSGVSIMRIKETLVANYSNAANTITKQITTPSKFFGAGPEFGVDMAYKIVAGLHLTGDAMGSLLVGTQKNSTTYQSVAPTLQSLGVSSPNIQKTHVPNKIAVVPALKGKLGLDYCFYFCEKAMIKIEAGYEAQVYFNALSSTNMGSEVVTPPVTPDVTGVYARTFQQELSNFALAGPYFKLQIGF